MAVEYLIECFLFFYTDFFLIILSCVLLFVEPPLELPSTPSRSRFPVTLPSSSRRSTGGAAVADQGVPGAPAHLEAAHLSARYVTLAWSEPDQPGESPVVGYTLYWKEFNSDRFLLHTQLYSPNTWQIDERNS